MVMVCSRISIDVVEVTPLDGCQLCLEEQLGIDYLRQLALPHLLTQRLTLLLLPQPFVQVYLIYGSFSRLFFLFPFSLPLSLLIFALTLAFAFALVCRLRMLPREGLTDNGFFSLTLGDSGVALIDFLQSLPLLLDLIGRTEIIGRHSILQSLQFEAFLVGLEGVEAFAVRIRLLVILRRDSSMHSGQRQQSTLTLFLADWQFDLSVLVVAFLDHATTLPHLPLAVLHALEPLSLVVRVLVPVHLPEAVAQVLHEGTRVIAASAPNVLALPVSFVVHVLALVLLLAELPHAPTETKAVLELSPID